MEMQENEMKVLKFDKGVKKTIDGEVFSYGILLGNEKIVFIKAGSGENHLGRENKYLKMAHRIRNRLGATVICASNYSDDITLDKKILKECVAKKGLNSCEIYFVGHSDGAYKNLFLAKYFKYTNKMFFINPSYIDVEGFTEKLNTFPNAEKILVYGKEDRESCEFVEYLNKFSAGPLQIIAVEGATHEFKGKLDEFVASIDLL